MLLTWDTVAVWGTLCFVLLLLPKPENRGGDWTRAVPGCAVKTRQRRRRGGGSCNLLSFFLIFCHLNFIFNIWFAKTGTSVLIDERIEVSKGGYRRRGIPLPLSRRKRPSWTTEDPDSVPTLCLIKVCCCFPAFRR